MWTITVIFVLFLAVAGNFGCASTARLNHRSVPSADEIPTASSLADDHSRPPVDIPASELAPNAAPAASLPELEGPMITHGLDPTSVPEPTLQTTQQPAESREGNSPSKDSSRDQAIADNRLLELLDRELDKAVEQPSESRRLQFSQEVIDHPKVRHFVKYYSITAKNAFHEILERSGKYMPMIAKVLKQEGLPEELGYLALLESEFIVNAKSRNGAVGLWQFIASTSGATRSSRLAPQPPISKICTITTGAGFSRPPHTMQGPARSTKPYDRVARKTFGALKPKPGSARKRAISCRNSSRLF
jgi:hypothetical protein